MKCPAEELGSLCLLLNTDHEIFRLRDEILAHEGPDVNFYGMAFY